MEQDDTEQEFEFSEADLLELDKEFLKNMDEKTLQNAVANSEDQSVFILFMILMVLLVLGFALAAFWIVKARRIRYRTKYRPKTFIPLASEQIVLT